MSLLAKLSMVSSSFPTGTRARANVFSSSSRTAPMAAHVPSKDSAAASDAVAPTRPVSAGHPAVACSSTGSQQPLPLAQVGNLADSGVVASTPTGSTQRIHCASSSSGPKITTTTTTKAGARAHAAAAAVRHAAQSASCAVRRAALAVPAAGTGAAARLGQLFSRCCRQQQQAAQLTGVAAGLDFMARNGDPLACPGVCGTRSAEVFRLIDTNQLGSRRFDDDVDEEMPQWECQTLRRIERTMPAVLVDFLGPQLTDFRTEKALSPAAIHQIAAEIREHSDVYQYVVSRFELDAAQNNFSGLPRDPVLRSAIAALDAKLKPMLRFKQQQQQPKQQQAQQSGGVSFRTKQHAADFGAYVRYMGRVHDADMQFGAKSESGGPGAAARSLAALSVLHLTGTNVHDSRTDTRFARDAPVALYYLFAVSRLAF
ncbi:hypothetical protein H9P43_007451 [Blastocladiella emersonii ATCC 22665]|nr:hypothetical protein H9P43_007448 [Blastocladiella emersonii ATCC 22665]KAI9173320.1 hypothetical protein H9P43_007451 [Blastocladiella emersonii ATCC 22665]